MYKDRCGSKIRVAGDNLCFIICLTFSNVILTDVIHCLQPVSVSTINFPSPMKMNEEKKNLFVSTKEISVIHQFMRKKNNLDLGNTWKGRWEFPVLGVSPERGLCCLTLPSSASQSPSIPGTYLCVAQSQS